MKQTIFNIVQSNAGGGMENIFIDYAKILNEANFKVICLSSSKFPQNNILDKEKIPRIDLNIKGHFDILATIKLFILIKKYQPKLIIAHNGRVFATLNLVKKLFKIKTRILAVSHGGNVKRLLNFNYAIAVANHIALNIQNKGFKGIVETIYNGIKIIDFAKNKESNEVFTFGMMSRLSPEKNIEIALKSFAKFAKETNKNAQLLIAGEGREKENLLKLAKELKIENKVKFIGWTQDKAGFFNQIDIFIQSSLNEPFGLTILEGFNHFTPVIAATVCGPREIIKNNETGFLFEIKNSEEDLFLKMEFVFKNPKILKKISKKAHEDLVENFSYKKMSNSLIDFVKESLHQK